MLLVKHNESDEKIEEAAKIMQDVQVETYGSMDYREKIEFILYQMKILIRKQDWIRLMIVSRKINPKYLEVEDLEDLTIIYYSYLFILHKNDRDYLDAAKVMKKIYDLLKKNAKRVQEMPSKTIDFGFFLDSDAIMTNSIFLSFISKQTEDRMALINEWKDKYQEFLQENPTISKVINTL